MVWEVNDGEGMDDFNADYGWKHEDECFDDGSRQYIKSTVAVDFLPYVGLLVQHWPSVCATWTKNTTGFLRCPCHCNFKYDEKSLSSKTCHLNVSTNMTLRFMYGSMIGEMFCDIGCVTASRQIQNSRMMVAFFPTAVSAVVCL